MQATCGQPPIESIDELLDGDEDDLTFDFGD